jgi:hypothetical protein
MTDTLCCGVLFFLLLLSCEAFLPLVTSFLLIVERGEDAALRRIQLYMTLGCNTVRIRSFDFKGVLETVKLFHFLYYSSDLQ